MAKRLLGGNSLAVFIQATLVNGSESKKKLKKSPNDLTNHVFPKRATLTKKRFVQRFFKKHIGMKTIGYVCLIIELNVIFGKIPWSTNDLAVLELDKE